MNDRRVVFALLVAALSSGVARGQSAPAAPEGGGSQGNAVPVIRVQVNRVLVPVVVLDKSGKAIAGLGKDDFQVLDEGKPHGISAMTVLGAKGAGEASAANGAAGAKAEAGGTASAEVKPQRFVVFLLDDLHMDMRDLRFVQRAASVLGGSLDAPDYAALVLMSGKSLVQPTRDRAKLLAGMNEAQNRPVFQRTGLECPNISYYQAVQMDRDRMADSPAFQTAIASAASCYPGMKPEQLEPIVKQVATKVLNAGRQDAQTSLAMIASAIKGLSTLPGERRLILVSPGFEAIEPESLSAEARVLDMALESNVIVSALDSRGVYVGNIGADEQGSVDGRSNAAMQDMRLTSLSNATSTMASLAYETGGSFFHNNNDLGRGFLELTRAPAMEYLLELSPEGLKADGKYHALTVKVKQKGVTVIARRGYVVRKPDEGKR